jgi:DNA-binding MarR family transcriptional regulator
MMSAMKDIRGPDLCHCLAVRRNARYLSRLYDRHLSKANLSSSQFSLLAMLASHPDISIADLAQIMVMERTTLLRALKPLQAAGLIVSRAEGKRSALRLFLSPDGKAKFEATLPAWNAAQAELEAEMGEELAASMRASLLAVVPDV